MRECIRKHLEMFLLHHVHSMCIMLGFGREGERRSCLVAAENFFLFFFVLYFALGKRKYIQASPYKHLILFS